MSDTKTCPECGHEQDEHKHAGGCLHQARGVYCKCPSSIREIELMLECDEARTMARKLYRLLLSEYGDSEIERRIK